MFPRRTLSLQSGNSQIELPLMLINMFVKLITVLKKCQIEKKDRKVNLLR